MVLKSINQSVNQFGQSFKFAMMRVETGCKTIPIQSIEILQPNYFVYLPMQQRTENRAC